MADQGAVSGVRVEGWRQEEPGSTRASFFHYCVRLDGIADLPICGAGYLGDGSDAVLADAEFQETEG